MWAFFPSRSWRHIPIWTGSRTGRSLTAAPTSTWLPFFPSRRRSHPARTWWPQWRSTRPPTATACQRSPRCQTFFRSWKSTPRQSPTRWRSTPCPRPVSRRPIRGSSGWSRWLRRSSSRTLPTTHCSTARWEELSRFVLTDLNFITVPMIPASML